MPRADGRQALVDKAIRREKRRLGEDLPEVGLTEADVRASVLGRNREDLAQLASGALKRGAAPSTGVIGPRERHILSQIDSVIVEQNKSVRSACVIVAQRLQKRGWTPLKYFDERARLKKATPEALRSFYRNCKRKMARRQV